MHSSSTAETTHTGQVSIPSIAELGARFYAWVSPNASLGDYPTLNGGFAYSTVDLGHKNTKDIRDASAVYFVLNGRCEEPQFSVKEMQELLEGVSKDCSDAVRPSGHGPAGMAQHSAATRHSPAVST